MLPAHGVNSKKPDTGQPSEVLTPSSDLQWLANKGELVVGFVSKDDVPFFYEKGCGFSLLS